MNKQVLILWVGLFIAIGLFFQNCSRNLVVDVPSANQASQGVSFQSKATCVFNGKEVPEGQAVQAYLNSTPEFTNGCMSENRFCRNGALSGSFTYARCQTGPKSCLFNGITIESGVSVQAYSAPNPTNCTSETRQCVEGRLSGSLPYSSCKRDVCLFNGRTLNPGEAFTYYLNSSGTCQAKTGNCQVGGFLVDSQRAPLTGQIYESCSGQGGACLLQSGETIAQNQTFTYFSPAAGCQAQQGYCDSQNQLRDASSQGVLSSPYGDAPTCNLALTVANSGIPSSGTNSGTIDQSLPNCHWKGQIVAWGSQFNYYYYPEGYWWQCQPSRGFCFPDGTLKTWPRLQSLNGDQIYQTCTVIPEPPPDGSNGG